MPGMAGPITQRGVDRRETFSCEKDRETYLDLLQQNLEECGVRLLGWCLMTNHIHVIAVPAREDSLSVFFQRVFFQRVQGRYAQDYNACNRRIGHLWQNRFFGWVLAADHLWRALAYVERHPVRAGIVARARLPLVERAGPHHQSGRARTAGSGMVAVGSALRLGAVLDGAPDSSQEALRAATYAGRPYGSEEFLQRMAETFDRHWTRGRPKKQPPAQATSAASAQFSLFDDGGSEK
jgi:putative transposase